MFADQDERYGQKQGAEGAMLQRCVSLVIGKHDDDFVYELPYHAGCKFYVCQGYGGAYSHTKFLHHALDFQMPQDTTICAARRGVVRAIIDQHSSGGSSLAYRGKDNRIEIAHDDGSVASYLHLMKGGVFVCLGQNVAAGEAIGLSGNTGWSSIPHLHFHVRDQNAQRTVPTQFRIEDGFVGYLQEGSWYTRPSPHPRFASPRDAVRPKKPTTWLSWLTRAS
jgi:murein DD-endopeptidase MepM/ murein hydrolase activator NlpD